MTVVNVLLACGFVVLSLMHLDDPERWTWMPAYGVGATLALFSCKPSMTAWTVRILATVSAATMFGYFAGFFSRAGYLSADWYAQPGSIGTLALLLAGLAMIPVTASYSCRMKPHAA
jgi:hypothetical protein